MDAKDVVTPEQARQLVNERGLSHVKVGVFDVDGVLRGKYMAKEKFLSALDNGFGFCDVVLGWDVRDQLYDNVSYTGWHTGYPDATVRIVPDTCRNLHHGRAIHTIHRMIYHLRTRPLINEPNMKQKITTMLELQDAMNSKVNSNWRNAAYEWYRAIWMEAGEMLEHFGWKWWKKQVPDTMQVKLEIVDIVHFALSIRLVQGGEQGSSLDAIAESIADDFANPQATGDIRTSIELLAKRTLMDEGAHFSNIAGIMNHLDMPFDELHEIYVGKNVLNIFRQDNGYKEGHYIKMWNGREDNEYLADILKKLDSDSVSFKADIYEALEAAYPEPAAA